jgi:outer membrane protein assembly factor BamB
VGVAVMMSSASVAVAQAPQSSPPDDWTMFHHDALHSGVSPDTTVGAAAMASGFNVRWHALGGGGAKGTASIEASPAIVYNAALGKTLVYVTTTGTPAALEAFDAKSGAMIWKDTIAASASSPDVYDGTVYFGDQQHSLNAVNATTGAPICSYNTTGDIQSSPVVGVVDGTGPVVFFGDQGTSEAHNAGHEWAINGVGNTNAACSLKWMFNSWNNIGKGANRTGSWSAPALATTTSGQWLDIFGSANPDDSVYALDAVTGAEVWRFQTQLTSGDQDVGAAPTVSEPGANGLTDGAVYINGKDKIEYAIDLQTGAQIWSFDMAANSGLDYNSVSGTDLVGDAVVVSYSEYTYELNATTGVLIWRSPATVGMMLASPSISGAPGDQVVFVGDMSGYEYAYKLSDGSLIASRDFGGAKTKIFSTAAISDGRVFVITSSPSKIFVTN